MPKASSTSTPKAKTTSKRKATATGNDSKRPKAADKKFAELTTQSFNGTVAAESKPCEADMEDAIVACDEDLFAGPQSSAVAVPGGTERTTLWLDDMVFAFSAVLDVEFTKNEEGGSGVDAYVLPKHVPRYAVLRVASVFFSVALHFCWGKSVSLNNKTIKAWSVLRPALQELVHKTFSEMKNGNFDGPMGGVSDKKVNTGVARLLASCSKDESDAGQEGQPQGEEGTGNSRDDQA